MRIQGKESGVALIVTLLLGLIAAGFIGAMMYMLGSGTRISGMEARYTSALQAAKGGASFITQEMSSFDLRCTDGSGNTCWCDALNATSNGQQVRCPATSGTFYNSTKVDLGATENLGPYDVNAELLSLVRNGTTLLLTFHLTSDSTRGTGERSEIEFVYRVQ
ncbi:MAG: hypothetical protein K9K39_07245 [Desulfohalobiaceae bacterium]|nr:hypothetical protein [Desulfohalobiaceae bacterium]